LPASFATLRVLDVGTFDGFYAFVAEARGARRVVAIDSEQHVEWVRARWGSEPDGGEGFRTIADLLGSRVEYRRLEASRLGELGETFDFVFCLGILHRVADPLGLLRMLRARLADSGRVLLETYGILGDDGSPSIRVHRPGDVYADDEFVYWGFGEEACASWLLLASVHTVSAQGSETPRSSSVIERTIKHPGPDRGCRPGQPTARFAATDVIGLESTTEPSTP
jgi:SAM-dependent methyltransferase